MYIKIRACANIICVLLCTAGLLFITFKTWGNDAVADIFFKPLTSFSDSIPATLLLNDNKNFADDTSALPDSARKVSIDTLSFSKDSLDAPVNYSAEDSGVLNIPGKIFILYGKTKTEYQDMNLEANTIKYDQTTNLITAYGGTDTATNNPLNKPKFTQGGAESIMDTIFFNMKTQKGLTKNTYYKEGELFVNAQTVKKTDKNIAYAYKGSFTTCNLDTPHFAIRARKLKMITNEIAISGPAYPEFEGVPIPIAIPFGIYPIKKGRHSGLLPPQFASNESFGLGLEGLGFYKVLSDNWDVTVRSNLYSYGGWKVDINPNYYKRYKYRGNLNLSIQDSKILNTSGLSTQEFSVTKSYFITWSHSTDTRARPGTSFTASVNAGSTKYNSLVSDNAFRNYNNNLNSSITYNKNWGQGKYNLSISANHNQNNNLGLINLNLPDVQFSATTFYPLKKKESVGTPKWYENLGIAYSSQVLTQISFYDSAFSFKQLLDTAQWGAVHSIPISVSLPALGPVIISPGISYDERWFGQKIIRQWDSAASKVDTTITRGFYTEREMSFSLSMSTRIFGTLNFKKSKNIVAIRHEIKPSFSINYKPDFVKKYFNDVQIDTAKNTIRVSQFDGGVVSGFGEGTFGGIGFGIDNLLEMKVKNKDSTADNPTKKIKLIDGLSIRSGYNFLADSLKLSPFSLSLRTTLFDKVNITGGANIDPYDTDTLGRRINHLLWKDGSPGRFTTGSLALSTSIKSKPKDNKPDAERVPGDATLTPDEQQRQLEYIRQNPADFVDFNIPWSLQLSYSLNFSRILSTTLKSYTTEVNSSVNINGDFSLSPKWKVGGGTFFDFRTAKIQTVSMFLTREMHCWQMAINIQVGQFKSFSITLNPKSGILRDLRINKRFLQQ